MGQKMNNPIEHIKYPTSETFKHGIWLIEPVMLSNEDASISALRGETTGTLVASIKFPGLEDNRGFDNRKVRDTLLRLADPYFPITHAFDTGSFRAKFGAPFYSTPKIYIGKPQIRIQAVYERASQAFEWILLAIMHANSVNDINTRTSKLTTLWTDKFMESYIESKTEFAKSLSSSG
jgi:hypothetical protein